MVVISISVAIIVVAIVFYLIYLGKYNKKFKEQQEAHEKSIATLIDSTKKKEEEFNDLIETQKNVIMSQRQELATLNVGLNRLKEKNETTESQKKSSEVRLGLMAENFMPFIRDYPYDHKNFRFLGNPVDGIQIDYTTDSLIIIEFKTGNAKLSKTQKYIRDIVSNGNVRFETFRVDEKGASLKVEAEVEENFTINSLIPKEII